MKEQTPQGPWYGRWGVNYIYGTSGVLRALIAVGVKPNSAINRAIEWLRSVQHDDGGFGESCNSYEKPDLMGRGDGTASQTAWALLGLITVVPSADASIQRGIKYLIEHATRDGTWNEEQFTGTGFPKVFYLKYHLYRHYFPLYALARYRQAEICSK
jgi:squalene-hopene/tetraprenyl-beta-curcumene cyclase